MLLFMVWLFQLIESLVLHFPGGSSGKESACQRRIHKRLRIDPWVRKIPWRREWQPTPVFLPGKSLGQRSLAGYSPCGGKSYDYYLTTKCVYTHACTEQFYISTVNTNKVSDYFFGLQNHCRW